jgi:hypothetical protein
VKASPYKKEMHGLLRAELLEADALHVEERLCDEIPRWQVGANSLHFYVSYSTVQCVPSSCS